MPSRLDELISEMKKDWRFRFWYTIYAPYEMWWRWRMRRRIRARTRKDNTMKVYGYLVSDSRGNASHFLCPVCARRLYALPIEQDADAATNIPLIHWYTPLGYTNREAINKIIDRYNLQPLHSTQIQEDDYCDDCLDPLL